jgi:hypothetical protein
MPGDLCLQTVVKALGTANPRHPTGNAGMVSLADEVTGHAHQRKAEPSSASTSVDLVTLFTGRKLGGANTVLSRSRPKPCLFHGHGSLCGARRHGFLPP